MGRDREGGRGVNVGDVGSHEGQGVTNKGGMRTGGGGGGGVREGRDNCRGGVSKNVFDL